MNVRTSPRAAALPPVAAQAASGEALLTVSRLPDGPGPARAPEWTPADVVSGAPFEAAFALLGDLTSVPVETASWARLKSLHGPPSPRGGD